MIFFLIEGPKTNIKNLVPCKQWKERKYPESVTENHFRPQYWKNAETFEIRCEGGGMVGS